MAETPKQLGFHLPAEWEEHSAVWLAWPHDVISFGSLNEPEGRTDEGRLVRVEQKFIKIIKAIHESEPVELLVREGLMQQRTSALMQKAGVDISKITFHLTDYADVWIRDYGPLFISNPKTHEQAWIKWTYNAYGEKFETLIKDNEVFFKLRGDIDKRMFEPELIMESGAIEGNGKGIILTTEQCLLKRNPKLNKTNYEKYFTGFLGTDKTIWLKQGLTNDHTDGHIDEIARFTSADTILCAYEEDETGPNFKILDENYQILKKATDQDGKPFKLVKLPMPHKKYNDGNKIPASYCNFYIGNTVVLAAVFNDPNDKDALKIIAACFPDRKVIPIDCSDIIHGGGAVHCMTQQVPSI